MAAVAVVVVRDDMVLLVKRAAGTYEGLWVLPSGHVEWNEDFLSAGLRETQEEAGVEVEIKGLLTVHSNFMDDGYSTLAVVLLAEPVKGTPRADGCETTDAAWFSHDDLPDLAWETDRHIIERYFEERLSGSPVDANYIRLALSDIRPVPPPFARQGS